MRRARWSQVAAACNTCYHVDVASQSTSVFLRGVPRDVMRLAKAEAARRGETLGRVVTSALRSALDPEATDAPHELANDVAWFDAHRPALCRKYEGSFVAIVDGRVIDHDRDFDKLARRVFGELGTRAIFMPRVEREPEVRKIRSPRTRRA